MFIIIIFLFLFFILNFWHIYTKHLTETEKKVFTIWYDTIIRRFVPEYNEILYNIYINQGFECKCWTNELIRAYKKSDETGKKALISFHKLVYHNVKNENIKN